MLSVVTVQDTTPPAITVLGDLATTACQFLPYTDAGATATDTCSGIVTVTTNNPIDTSTAGAYTVTYVATDATGNTSSATRVVTVGPCNATITQQPQDTNVDANASFTLSVTAVAGDTITYQWKRGANAVPIVDATNSTYTVDHAFRTNADIYFVEVTSGPTTITSSSATVTVNDPVFTVNPTSATSLPSLPRHNQLHLHRSRARDWSIEVSMVFGDRH